MRVDFVEDLLTIGLTESPELVSPTAVPLPCVSCFLLHCVSRTHLVPPDQQNKNAITISSLEIKPEMARNSAKATQAAPEEGSLVA